jgi:hypothetical protein
MKNNATVTKQITDMSKYGITGENQWEGTVIVKTDTGISLYVKYFPTREQTEEYADKLLLEIEG